MLKKGKRRISRVSGMSNTVAGSITLILAKFSVNCRSLDTNSTELQ